MDTPSTSLSTKPSEPTNPPPAYAHTAPPTAHIRHSTSTTTSTTTTTTTAPPRHALDLEAQPLPAPPAVGPRAWPSLTRIASSFPEQERGHKCVIVYFLFCMVVLVACAPLAVYTVRYHMFRR